MMRATQSKPDGGQPGRIGHYQSVECRRPMMDVMEFEPQYKHFIQRVKDGRVDKEDAGKSSMGNINKDQADMNTTTTTRQTFILECEESSCTCEGQDSKRKGPHEPNPRRQYGCAIE